MIPYTVLPRSIGFVQIYGIFVALGFFIAITLLVRYARRKNSENEKKVYDISFLVLIAAIAGARASYVLGNLELYKDNWLDVFNLMQGGMSYFGGFTLAVVSVAVYCKLKKINFLEYADLFSVYIPLGQAIGRIGNYLIGEHIGKVTSMPFGVSYNGEIRHQVAMYDFFANLLIFSFLLKLRKYNVKQGTLFASYITLYGLFRFLTGFLRVNEKLLASNVSYIQIFSLSITLLGIIWLTILYWRGNESKVKMP